MGERERDGAREPWIHGGERHHTRSPPVLRANNATLLLPTILLSTFAVAVAFVAAAVPRTRPPMHFCHPSGWLLSSSPSRRRGNMAYYLRSADGAYAYTYTRAGTHAIVSHTHTHTHTGTHAERRMENHPRGLSSGVVAGRGSRHGAELRSLSSSLSHRSLLPSLPFTPLSSYLSPLSTSVFRPL